ncbi:D-erythronate dehydrogenase [Pelagovum pacificum]|uniref:SDR family oxidoreductase n=1 Tax=Pelagovum pacificum TaxID=2588711 RepID=A0A5C5G7C4_9RHOB|nr:D-erythronate dehydrogenase [Pelagovum pacificum]QQA41950.1 SDR family oxidoreductase [Pelagovum pacificum]TNY30609.1 SDR family oxidoreductase [Pelagovum pacificum]
MHVMVLGAAGMIGRKLSQRLAATGEIDGKNIDRLTLADTVAPEGPEAAFPVETVTFDLCDPADVVAMIGRKPDIIIHLAAIVSGEAEADFEKGYAVNLDGTRLLLEAIRAEHERDGYRPRFVFASSIAVFGAPFPTPIGDEFVRAPLTSYGTQKAICELLLNDYSRRGLVDGIGIRLPTICIRPGLPNKAASGFFSSILREPLVGQEAVLPVADTVRHWFASPRTAVDFLVHAAALHTEQLGPRRCLSMPGIMASVGEQIEALGRVAGDKATSLIRREPDETIAGIVAGWPEGFEAKRAESLGFRADASFDDIIRIHITDELDGKVG